MSEHHIVRALETSSALLAHAGRFQRPSGADLLSRTESFYRWHQERSRAGVWPYSRTLTAPPLPTASIRDESGKFSAGLNFASQDYLGLASHPAVHAAVMDALERFGPHSAGSPVLLGNTSDSLALERDLADVLQMPEVLLFPTGWAAGFAAIRGLVREQDHIILDECAHACLQEGARAATRHVVLVPHLDTAATRARLTEIRAADAKNAVLVVTEGLFSMNSDQPDLETMQRDCRELGATLLVDIAHDFGATGPEGLGSLGRTGMVGQVDLVMGSFSKTFAANGGFIASHSPAVRQFLKIYGGPHVFSNAISPLQVAAVRAALAVVRSPEGEMRRDLNARGADALRDSCRYHGLRVLGHVSPIVPVVIGGNRIARVASALLAEAGVLANLVEYPAVPLNSTLFRFQVMSTHTPEQCAAAASALAAVVAQSQGVLDRLAVEADADSTPESVR